MYSLLMWQTLNVVLHRLLDRAFLLIQRLAQTYLDIMLSPSALSSNLPSTVFQLAVSSQVPFPELDHTSRCDPIPETSRAYLRTRRTRTGIAIGRPLETLQETVASHHKAIVPILGMILSKAGCTAIAHAYDEVESTLSVSGAAKLDILANNAGILTNDGANVEDISQAFLQANDEDWAKGFAVNVSSI